MRFFELEPSWKARYSAHRNLGTDRRQIPTIEQIGREAAWRGIGTIVEAQNPPERPVDIRSMTYPSLRELPPSNLSGILVGGAAVLLAGCGEPASGPTATSTTATWRSVAGEALAADSSCTACHTAGPDTIRRLGVSRSPQLLGDTGIGSRLSADGIRRRLGAHGGELGLRMPDLLHGLEPGEKAAAVEDLVNFLVSQGGPIDPIAGAMEASSTQISQGSALWESVGCTACHGVDPANAIGLEDLTTSWTHGSLTTYLADPLAVHPGGRMPSLNLTNDEASSLAAYLLAGDGVLTVASRPGLQLHYFDGDFDGMGPIEEIGGTIDPIRVPIPGVGPHVGEDTFGLRLSGEIEIPTTGVWNFYLTSDDGSGLKIDGKTIVDNSGIHGAVMKRGSATLDAGRHAIDIGFFEASGGEALSLSWSGPGIARQPIPAEAFFSDTTVLAPDWAPFEINEASAQRGMMRFAKTGCGTCHVPEMPKLGDLANIAPLSSLIAGRGCLAAEVPAAAPDFGFTATERSLLDELISNVAALEEPLPADLAVAHTMTRLNCIACHARPDVGGPTTEALTRFAANDEAELGDEGRIPPSLDDVGNKLQLNALRNTLANGEKVRPYMKARMPVFGAEQTDDLVVHFVAADAIAADGREPVFDEARVAAGHALTGVDGVSCVQCHTVAGHPALGVPAVDLASMHARIRPGWFRKHLLDPQKTNPGTRMTAFWGNGGTERIFPEHLGGDPTKQVDAIRTYLSLGESMPLPSGVVPDAGEYALVPIDEPILFGTFMRDVSPRTIAVGLPENVHYAWDAEHARLAKAWRGGFMDAEGTWRGRAGQLERPEGRSTLQMPAGPAIAVLSTRDEAWPSPFNRDAAGIRNGAWRFAGTTRDRDRRPAFNSELDGVRITETPIPRLAEGGTRLVRRFTVGSDEGRGDLYMRAAVATSIDPVGGEGRERVWTINGERMIRINGAESFVRPLPGGGAELLVKVPLSMVGREDVAFEGVFDVEMSW